MHLDNYLPQTSGHSFGSASISMVDWSPISLAISMLSIVILYSHLAIVRFVFYFDFDYVYCSCDCCQHRVHYYDVNSMPVTLSYGNRCDFLHALFSPSFYCTNYWHFINFVILTKQFFFCFVCSYNIIIKIVIIKEWMKKKNEKKKQKKRIVSI